MRMLKTEEAISYLNRGYNGSGSTVGFSVSHGVNAMIC